MRVVIPVLVLLVLLFAACGNTSSGPRVPDNYRTWEKEVDRVLDYPIAGHGNTYRIVYVNAIGAKTEPVVRNGRRYYDFPDGTIIVKEVYATKEDLDKQIPGQLTVMVKDRNSPQAIDGWLWIVKTPGASAENVFKSKFCLECHLDANEVHTLGPGNPDEEFRDYVFFPYHLKKE